MQNEFCIAASALQKTKNKKIHEFAPWQDILGGHFYGQ